LPLCTLRDMTPLSSLSAVGVTSVLCIAGIVVYLYFADDDEISNDDSSHNINNHTGSSIRQPGGSLYENWFEVRWYGFLECLGTFVFSFVSQHTCHLAFGSLRPELRTLANWKKVSTWSLSIAGSVSLIVGLFAYLTFWEQTKSDIFQLYPPIPIIDMAKLALCVTMLLTFPLPLFTCRELLIVLFAGGMMSRNSSDSSSSEPSGDEEVTGGRNDDGCVTEDVEEGLHSHLTEPLLPNADAGTAECNDKCDDECDQHAASNEVLSTQADNVTSSVLLPGEDRQLRLPYHLALTFTLWFVVTGLAIAAPSLGDVLDLVGCASGTIIAFVFPGTLALKFFSFCAATITFLTASQHVSCALSFHTRLARPSSTRIQLHGTLNLGRRRSCWCCRDVLQYEETIQ